MTRTVDRLGKGLRTGVRCSPTKPRPSTGQGVRLSPLDRHAGCGVRAGGGATVAGGAAGAVPFAVLVGIRAEGTGRGHNLRVARVVRRTHSFFRRKSCAASTCPINSGSWPGRRLLPILPIIRPACGPAAGPPRPLTAPAPPHRAWALGRQYGAAPQLNPWFVAAARACPQGPYSRSMRRLLGRWSAPVGHRRWPLARADFGNAV